MVLFVFVVLWGSLVFCFVFVLSLFVLHVFLYSMKQHKHEVMQTLLKLQFRKSQQAQRLEMLENLTDDMKESLKVSPHLD